VGIITNIQADHIGQDGIEDIDDLIWIKGLVAERVREGGTLILNADDPNSAGLAENERVLSAPKKIVFFAMRGDNRIIQQQRANGEAAYYVRDGWIVEAAGRAERRIIQPANIPATLGGIAEFNIANALAAIAALRALGVPPAMIYLALSRFNPNENNPGRLNMYAVNRGYVVIDYGHNPPAYENMARLVAAWKQEGRRVTGIIGLPGDRADWVTQAAARVAARGFDRIIVREDHDRRGRATGELMALIRDAIEREAPGVETLEIADEAAALEAAISTMQQEEVVVLFYDQIDAVHAVLARHGALNAATTGETLNVLKVNVEQPEAAVRDRYTGQ
jgi:cyanophycin synthetase